MFYQLGNLECLIQKNKTAINMKKINILFCCGVFFLLFFACTPSPCTFYFVEAESFTDKGGWVMDNQSEDQMGSPYLLAHGLGVPVKDAQTTILVKETGCFYFWVRTRDWVKTWNKGSSPGRFNLKVNGKAIETVFGTDKAEWSWQYGGKVKLNKGDNQLQLHDLTGFEGRCDAIYFSTDPDDVPFFDKEALTQFRRTKLGISEPIVQGSYDLVVVGGGIAGISSAVSAARLGCKVALIQDRPVLGGNNSSEVRVGLSGLIMQQPYPKLGFICDETGYVGVWNYKEALKYPQMHRSAQILKIIKAHPEVMIHNGGPKSNYGDNLKLLLVKNEPNISLFLNMHVFHVRMQDKNIEAVIARENLTGKEYSFKASQFADCTGDGTVGYLAGADYSVGRESKSAYNEPSALPKKDKLVMGTSVQWYSVVSKEASFFPDCPWAVQFDENTCQKIRKGDWMWETGMNHDQITEIEYIRDYGLRAVYGNWSFLKNHSKDKEQFVNDKLKWAAYIGGKRESRRLLGDFVLREQDIIDNIAYKDASFTTTWPIDLHFPDSMKIMKEEPFKSYCVQQTIKPYAVPYRCLYSRNINNLFMAGRDISVSHIALGTVRVMRTCGMMGEVVGMAVSLCKEKNTTPRGVYKEHLNALKTLMRKGMGKVGFPKADKL